MAHFKTTSFGLEHHFDTNRKRQFLNGIQTVFHCHHYTLTYTQLALDTGETSLLEQVAQENFYAVLVKYFKENNINKIVDKIELSAQYYEAVGLGKVNILNLNCDSGVVISTNSHIEEGWLKKWGVYDKPVNYIGCGFVCAMFAAIQDQPVDTYKAFEEKSIAKGDECTIFKVVKK